MVEVVFKKELVDYLDELVHILFKEAYFSYPENAQIYVDTRVDFINDTITTFPSKVTPQNLKHLGSNYIFYKSNKRTTWYVFFENKKNAYVITGIINSYCMEAAMLQKK